MKRRSFLALVGSSAVAAAMPVPPAPEVLDWRAMAWPEQHDGKRVVRIGRTRYTVEAEGVYTYGDRWEMLKPIDPGPAGSTKPFCVILDPDPARCGPLLE